MHRRTRQLCCSSYPNAAVPYLSPLVFSHWKHCIICFLKIEYKKAGGDIYDDFGVSKSKWHPYWIQNEILADGKVYISYFVNDKNETLLFITSLEKGVDKVDIKLDKQYSKIYDLLDDNENTTVDGDTAHVPLEYANIKICKLIV